MTNNTETLTSPHHQTIRDCIIDKLQQTPKAFSIENLINFISENNIGSITPDDLALLLIVPQVAQAEDRDGVAYWHRSWEFNLDGELSVTSTGVGFLSVPPSPIVKSISLKPNTARQFFHGDTLSCDIRPTRNDGKWVAFSVARTRIRDAFTGRIRSSGENRFETIPLDTRIRHQFFYMDGAQFNPNNIYCIEPVMKEDKSDAPPFITLIGPSDKRTTFVDAALLEQHWVHTPIPAFKPCDLYVPPSLDANYLDLTDIPFMSVSNNAAATYREHAVFVSQSPNGFSVKVAISDVTLLVKIGGEIDVAAAASAGILQLPFFTEKMLPDIITQQECALNALHTTPKYALVANLEYHTDGTVRGFEFTTAKIRVAQNCSFSELQDFCDGEHLEFPPEVLSVCGGWMRLSNLLLRQHESNRFTLPKVDRFDAVILEDGSIKEFTKPTTLFSHKMVECLMFEVNVSAGKLLAKHQMGIFRAQHFFDGFDVECIRQELSLLKPQLDLSSDTLESFVNQVPLSDWPQHLQTQLQKHLKKPEYTTQSSYLYNLGAPSFASITSPMRRYVDIVNIRCLKHITSIEKLPKLVSRTDWLEEAARKGNLFDKISSSTNRAFWHMASMNYLKQFDGQMLPAVVTQIKPSTVQVLLNNTSIIMDLSMHIYKPRPIYDYRNQTLVVNEHTTLSVGAPVLCQVDFKNSPFFPLSIGFSAGRNEWGSL